MLMHLTLIDSQINKSEVTNSLQLNTNKKYKK